MRIKIPKYSWVKIFDDNGILLREECIQQDLMVVTESHNREKSDSEIPATFGTMAHDGGIRP